MADNPILAGRVPGNTFDTKLDPGTEQFFRQWVVHNKVPFNPDASGLQDYDMRGFYQGLQQQNPKAQTAINANDNSLHFTDYWKTPQHQTFSNESQWASATAPQWSPNDQLIAPSGKIVFDEKLANTVPSDVDALVKMLRNR